MGGGHDVGPTAAIDALGPPGALGAQYPSTTQLILEVGVRRDNGNDSDNGPGVSVEEELAGLARLAAAQGLAPGRLVPAVRFSPVSTFPPCWRRGGPTPVPAMLALIVVIPTATPATSAGLVAAAVMAGVAVATDDARRRVIEVLLAIEQHRHTDRPGDRARPDDEGELR